MTVQEINERYDEELAKLAAKFEAARKIREALNEAEKLLGEDFNEDEIFDIVNE